ncbi:MAG: IS66 family transposase [Candidatus Rokubacteria bacterium]|nr:IS66 family transposase [Candidatus Rokubacteria bacterium]
MNAPRTRKDIAAIGELLRSLIVEGRAEEAIDAALAMLLQVCERNSELTLRLEQMRRERSGRRSEKIDPAQLALMIELVGGGDDPEEAAAEEDEDGLDELQGNDENGQQRPSKGRARRARPPKHLPREVIEYRLPEEQRRCEGCGEPMGSIGDDVSEQLEFVSAHFRVKEHRRAKYACRRCKRGVKTAPGPDKLIDKGLPGTGLLAHVVVSKYNDHLPLSRQSGIYEREGVEIPVSTLCDWVAAVADEMHPLVDLIRERTLEAHIVQTDASGLKVLDRDDPEGVRKGTMWCYVGDRKWVYFEYARTGTGAQGPWETLRGREGYVQADAASVFDRVYNGQCGNAIEVGCWSHARRKHYGLKDTDPRVAYPLQLIGKLYRVEAIADARSLGAEARVELRQERSSGILGRLKRWLVKTAAREPPESALHKACAYSLNQWEALTRFLEDGRVGLDNNLCELQIRSLAVGRKNYLHAGSDAGAERAAALYTVLRTCALNRVDAFAYVKDVLDKLAAGWPQQRVEELLPDAWAASCAVTQGSAARPDRPRPPA